MIMTQRLKGIFKERERRVLNMILDTNITFDAIGIFGSWAREESKGTSDIDFFVVGDRPDRVITGELRSDAECMGADIVFVSKDYFVNDSSLFAQNLRRDAVFLVGGEEFGK